MRNTVKEELDDYGYPLEPRTIGANGWYYEERDGLLVYSTPGNRVKISWARIEKSLLNHKAVMAKKKRKGRRTR